MAAAAPVRLRRTDRKLQILRVATVLFARRGFQGTTTREIARRAGVNEAIIFRHFPTKEDLYWGVIDAKCRAANSRRQLKQRLQEAGSDREIFTNIAHDVLERNRDTTLSRLLLFSALERHELSQRFFNTYIAKRYELLAEHIAGRIREGKFRAVDPLLAARGFLGMVIYHFLIQEIFGGKRFQKFDRRIVAQTLADIWLAGMLATNDPLAASNGLGKQ